MHKSIKNVHAVVPCGARGLNFGLSLHMKGVNKDRSAVDHMGLVARKPVFGVSDKVSFKTVSSATETS